jgi:hypothetical protein
MPITANMITLLSAFGMRAMKYPDWLKRSAKKFLNARGDLYCPVCDSAIRTFEVFDAKWPEREGEICPVCRAFARHRWLWLCMKQESIVKPGATVLEFAPTSCLTRRMRRAGMKVTTTDLYADNVDVRADICALPFPPQSFDIVLCSMVLEHIPDDIKAMQEIHRVLRPHGKVFITVPIRDGRTYENSSVTTPEDREKHFGQMDHVRFYGMDIVERLERTGFQVSTVDVKANILPEVISRISLATGEGDVILVGHPGP